MSIFKYLTISHLQKVLAALETRFLGIENDVKDVKDEIDVFSKDTKDTKKGNFYVTLTTTYNTEDIEEYSIDKTFNEILSAHNEGRDCYLKDQLDNYIDNLFFSSSGEFFYTETILFQPDKIGVYETQELGYTTFRFVIRRDNSVYWVESPSDLPLLSIAVHSSTHTILEATITPTYNEETSLYEATVVSDLWNYLLDGDNTFEIITQRSGEGQISWYESCNNHGFEFTNYKIKANPDNTVLIQTNLDGSHTITIRSTFSFETKARPDYLRSFQSDWEEDDMGNTRYVANRPAIRAGDGENSVMVGQMENLIAEVEPDAILLISGDAKATTYAYTTEDDMSGLARTNTVALYNNKVYSLAEAINKTDNLITFTSTLSSSTALTNAEIKLYKQKKIVIGNNAVAEGSYTAASGSNSHAEGSNTRSIGNYSHAEGYGTSASGAPSHAEGMSTVASGLSSHAEGLNSVASGSYSHAEGAGTIASGLYSHAEGSITIASGKYSHAEGNHTEASGEASHAEGIDTKASGNLSHVEGYFSVATRPGSHAEGWKGTSSVIITGEANTLTYTVTDGPYLKNVSRSIAMAVEYSDIIYPITSIVLNTSGILTSITLESTLSDSATFSSTVSIHIGNLTSGNGAHAEGVATHAAGTCSHTEGLNTIASACAHAEGTHTLASSSYQHVQGKFNIEDSNNVYAHIVGNGTEVNARSNAHTLDWSGNGWYAGKLTVGAGPVNNMDVATKQYVDTVAASSSVSCATMNEIEEMCDVLGLRSIIIDSSDYEVGE